ncbi:glycoside hydrolase family 43 protein [Diplogelasinospora grovesii]|uniref:Glycoside hydrolase family 43 protein n=1 Tax=Diplogelasinospora grovesii TaxID=303347 RepID=A0AAN6NBK5_9PEZI|nr:glycoside hydrolase family 43 protein [Diplogelasinospora grovesii]
MYSRGLQCWCTVLLSLSTAPVLGSLQVVPGGTWTASNGEHLNAHGAGVIKVNDTFYLVGEDKSQGSAFVNVNCFSSADLVQWKYEGALLSRTSTTASGDLGPGRIIERPKVIYNDKTQKYVLWMHVDSSSYGEAKVGVATGDTVCGKYTYLRSFKPLGFESRDMGLFKDDDGTAYLLTEDRKNGIRINKLTPDYLDVLEGTYLWKDHIEAPALVKYNSRYYMFGSHLTGWDANDNVYSTSTSLASGWSAWATFAEPKSNTYTSQTAYILDYGNGNIMYLGDRWVSKNLQASTYVWLPLLFSGDGKVSMKNHASWVPNVGGGSWEGRGNYTTYIGTNGKYSGGAKDVSCGACAGGKAAGYVGGSDQGTVTMTGIRGSGDTTGAATTTTVQIRYVNADSKPRYAGVTVNGGQVMKVAFEPTSGDTSVSILNVVLRSGENTVTIGGIDGGWGPDVDRLLVPTQ